MTVRVEVGARLHIGFGNLSLAHERLYGGVGVALDEPCVRLAAEAAGEVICSDSFVSECAGSACDRLGVPGVELAVESTLPRHAGLGSGTQVGLAVLAAVAAAYDRQPLVRDRAPDLGRGGRSGVGVAAFERGGFIVDAGHPTERFTTAPPADGEWTVPAVAARHRIPEEWRFVLVVPDAEPGRSGDDEDESMRAVVEGADPAVADELSTVLVRRLLPAVAEGRLEAFGNAVAAFGRLNGAWYADQQGGVYRPPAGRIIDALADRPAVRGVGQSSWGPTVYGVTDVSMARQARNAAETALASVDAEGAVQVVAPDNEGARVVAGGGSTI